MRYPNDIPGRSFSIGNYFLAAAQGFFRSLPSAIFLFSSITHSQVDLDFFSFGGDLRLIGKYLARNSYQPYCHHRRRTGRYPPVKYIAPRSDHRTRRMGQGSSGSAKYPIQFTQSPWWLSLTECLVKKIRILWANYWCRRRMCFLRRVGKVLPHVYRLLFPASPLSFASCRFLHA